MSGSIHYDRLDNHQVEGLTPYSRNIRQSGYALDDPPNMNYELPAPLDREKSLVDESRDSSGLAYSPVQFSVDSTLESTQLISNTIKGTGERSLSRPKFFNLAASSQKSVVDKAISDKSKICGLARRNFFLILGVVITIILAAIAAAIGVVVSRNKNKNKIHTEMINDFSAIWTARTNTYNLSLQSDTKASDVFCVPDHNELPYPYLNNWILSTNYYDDGDIDNFDVTNFGNQFFVDGSYAGVLSVETNVEDNTDPIYAYCNMTLTKNIKRQFRTSVYIELDNASGSDAVISNLTAFGVTIYRLGSDSTSVLVDASISQEEWIRAGLNRKHVTLTFDVGAFEQDIDDAIVQISTTPLNQNSTVYVASLTEANDTSCSGPDILMEHSEMSILSFDGLDFVLSKTMASFFCTPDSNVLEQDFSKWETYGLDSESKEIGSPLIQWIDESPAGFAITEGKNWATGRYTKFSLSSHKHYAIRAVFSSVILVNGSLENDYDGFRIVITSGGVMNSKEATTLFVTRLSQSDVVYSHLNEQQITLTVPSLYIPKGRGDLNKLYFHFLSTPDHSISIIHKLSVYEANDKSCLGMALPLSNELVNFA
ncbi:uncharacterized protein V1516DRAFT_663941 [Lipomyces oligophaga]|uniref:uncharacterized protein n=1 Tax=Lipomyces oligophaga TaxID=45792 RepID=UPI0034CFC560